MRGKIIRKRIAVLGCVAVVIVAAFVSYYFLTQRNVGRLISQGKHTNILFLGLDNAGDSNRSDTMMLVSLAPGEDIALLSLPRDLRVKFDNGEFHKLNASYAIGGADLACETVSSLLGVSVPFYLTLDYLGFEQLIDHFGGVDIIVEEPMKYDDYRADPPLHIDIQAGAQRLDGKTALDYIRYRGGNSGDMGRITRQQKLIGAILGKGLQHQSIGSIRDIVRAIYPYLRTNLSLIDLYDLAKLLQGLDSTRLQMATVPGVPVLIDEISYLEPQVIEMEQLVARLIKGINILTPNQISVAVFNGSGQPLAASNTATYLHERAFRISKVANAETFDYDQTYIVALTGKEAAQILERALSEASIIVFPDEFEPHYSALKSLVPAGTDLILVTGVGFKVDNG
ncbi:LCP family protein [Candidatus Bipolaricaulota bacterium]|nr:LCP family protein [Candidatus Bipolaricaulota bacterium]